MSDPTENARRQMVAKQQMAGPKTREQLEAQYGQVWNQEELNKEFKIIGFGAPIVVVRRLSDGVLGSCTFQLAIGHRFYHSFEVHK